MWRMWATAQERGSAPPAAFLPPTRPATPSCARNTLPGACTHVHAALLRDMDVHELGSPGEAITLSLIVAFSNKRKRTPLARSTSPAPRRPPRESDREMWCSVLGVRACVREKGQVHSRSQWTGDSRSWEVPGSSDVLPDVGRPALR